MQIVSKLNNAKVKESSGFCDEICKANAMKGFQGDYKHTGNVENQQRVGNIKKNPTGYLRSGKYD